MRWQDRQAALLGKLMLLKGLTDQGYPAGVLDRIKHSSYGRPYIEGAPDFNISHSGEYIFCAIAERGRVGVDVEKVTPIDIHDFRRFMSDEEWAGIDTSTDRLRCFYDTWTLKESVIKADGRGLSAPFTRIHFAHNKAVLDDSIWYVARLVSNSSVSAFLAYDHENEIVMQEIEIQEWVR